MSVKRTRQLNILLSEDEWQKLMHLADERGLNVSDTLRHFIRREHEASQSATPLERDAAIHNAAVRNKKES